MDSTECCNCGKEIEVSSHKLNRNKNNFCNRSCYLEWHKADIVDCYSCEKETKKGSGDKSFCDRSCYLDWHSNNKDTACESCGENLSVVSSRFNKNNNSFCDRSCYLNYHRNSVILNCENENCKNYIKLENNAVTENNFCSRECYYLWLSKAMRGEGNHQYKGANESHGFTDAEREKIFRRDSYICQDCGDSNAFINAHHISPVYERPDLEHEIENGITLCVECHANRHQKMSDEHLVNLIRSQLS